jgi:glutamate-1-semialdehyde 2,1-aminomutase
MEMVRFGNSGTEVTMHAIRVARGYTGKDKIIKLEGGYHGPHDYALWSSHPPLGQVGPARLPSSVQMSAGIPKCLAGTIIVIPFNDIEALEYAVRKYEGEIAAFILEPVMGNATLILPKKGYLEKVREITERENIVLIFDEIITGCRVSYEGASGHYKVKPDMITLSKAIGGGFSIAAFGGKKAIMEQLQAGTVAHFGTYNANPIGITACLTTLRDILTPEATKTLISKSDKVFEAMREIIKETGVPAQLQHVGAMGCVAFTDTEVVDYRTMATADSSAWHKFFITMLNKGVIMIGANPTETIFFSVQHTDGDYDQILGRFRETLKTLPRSK